MIFQEARPLIQIIRHEKEGSKVMVSHELMNASD